MSGGSSPKPPDYIGAAKQQGIYNLLSAIQTGIANNPSIYNPYGTQQTTWAFKKDKAGNVIQATPTVRQKLSKNQQALLNKSELAKINLANNSINSSKAIQAATRNPLSFKGLAPLPKNANAARADAFNAMMSRVNTDTGLQREDANSSLIAAGLRPGTAAYETAMDRIGRQYNDARNNALLSAGQEASRDFGLNMQARQQGISERQVQRQTPINEFNALQTGSQINSPFAGGLGFQGGASVQAAPYMQGVNAQGQAQQNQYNQQTAMNNANLQAGAGLVGSLGSAWLGR
jgi:hypothetical protein